MDTYKLRGCYATIVTPFLQGNEIDEPELKKEIDFLCETNITGLFPLASTSEFPFLSYESKRQYLRAVAQANRGRKAMLAGCCGVNDTETMSLLELAAQYGYDAAVVCPPYYFSQSADALYRYYMAIAQNPYNVKIILYNIPAFTAEIPVELVARLMRNPNIIGIKDSSGNMRRISNIADYRRIHNRPDFLIYLGNDDILLPGITAGSDGSLSAICCVLPEVVAHLYESYDRGDMEGAQTAQRSIVELTRLAESLPFPAGYKMIAKARGMNVGVEHTFCDPAAAETVNNRIKEIVERITEAYNCQGAVM